MRFRLTGTELSVIQLGFFYGIMQSLKSIKFVVWRTLLSQKNSVIPLYTIEEDVIPSPDRSSEPYCEHCRFTEWSNHLVPKRTYHFLIPIGTDWNMPLDDDVFHLQTHLLHGLIHSNGFGHLICINGMEGGSRYLSGREIVDLWDMICSNLGARMITVEDLSKKRSLDLRLLYGVAYGHSWFGRWGYKFRGGSYGVTKNDYENAVELLGSLELDKIEFDFAEHGQSKEIKQIFQNYRDMSQGRLKAFKDLLQFMLSIKFHAPQASKLLPSTPPLLTEFPHRKISNRLFLKKSDIADNEKPLKHRNYSDVAANLVSRWPVRRLEFAAGVIAESLKKVKAMKQRGMTRQAVRDAARLRIGDAHLLESVLKSINNAVVGNVLVGRYVDPVTRILRYTIQELDDMPKAIEPKRDELVVHEITPLMFFAALKPGADVHGDLLLLYNNVLLNYPDSELVRTASQTILDSKHFVKEWPLWNNNDKVLQFVCRVKPSLIGMRLEQTTELPPGELVTVPLQATVFDLKQAIEEAFRDTYCSLSNFVVDEIDEVKEDMSLIETGSVLTVSGFTGGDWRKLCTDVAELVRAKLGVMELLSLRSVCRDWRLWTDHFESKRSDEFPWILTLNESGIMGLFDGSTGKRYRKKIESGSILIGSVGSWILLFEGATKTLQLCYVFGWSKIMLPNLPPDLQAIVSASDVAADPLKPNAVIFILCRVKGGRSISVLRLERSNRNWQRIEVEPWLGFDGRFVDGIFWVDKKIYLSDRDYEGFFYPEHTYYGEDRRFRGPAKYNIEPYQIAELELPRDSSTFVVGTLIRGERVRVIRFRNGSGRRLLRVVYIDPIFQVLPEICFW